jgi:hypothetical protein
MIYRYSLSQGSCTILTKLYYLPTQFPICQDSISYHIAIITGPLKKLIYDDPQQDVKNVPSGCPLNMDLPQLFYSFKPIHQHIVVGLTPVFWQLNTTPMLPQYLRMHAIEYLSSLIFSLRITTLSRPGSFSN